MGDSIMEMKNVYKSLNEQKLYYEQELIRKKKRSCMKSRRFFRQKTSGGKAIHRQARTEKGKQAFSTLQDQIL